jgi:DNA sulfur modification protein DndC
LFKYHGMAKQASKDSIFSTKNLSDIYSEIQNVYLNYSLPWVIGYSGGKDSTATLQLIWNALLQLPAEKRTNPVYVISSDTLVETPVIVNYISRAIEQMNTSAKAAGLNLTAHKLNPELQDTFWVNLIGKGYPAPNNTFRWCTDRMKIKPSNKFILDRVTEHGEVILALGMRKDESSTRNRVIANHEIKGYQLSRHGQLRGSWVFMPIEKFSADDVWSFLLSQPISPWGSNNRDLASLYRSAQAGECPLVVDDTTPSCGNSRFGCWTCTVVGRDRSMEAMIDSGEEWMSPLLDFRDWLSSTQNPEVKPMQREFKSRDGKINLKSDGNVKYRTYTLDFSRQMLEKLLATQEKVQRHDPSYELISEIELNEIRRIWISERQDWGDSLPGIYEKVTSRKLQAEFSDVFVPGGTELEVLSRITERHDVPLKLVQKLLNAEWQTYGMYRRSTIHNTIEKIFNEDWRSLDEVRSAFDESQKEIAS